MEQGGLPEFRKDFDGAEAFVAVASDQKIRCSRSRLGGRCGVVTVAPSSIKLRSIVDDSELRLFEIERFR